MELNRFVGEHLIELSCYATACQGLWCSDLEQCEFSVPWLEQNYSYVQVAYTINKSKQTEDR